MTLACLELAKILIVDDEAANLRLLERILHEEGFYSLTTLSHPAAVLETVIALQPDLILLDLHMPDLDGFQVLERLQAVLDPVVPVPIIMLTADSSPHMRWRALGLGADQALRYPGSRLSHSQPARNPLAPTVYVPAQHPAGGAGSGSHPASGGRPD